jgi:hypothetical protein
MITLNSYRRYRGTDTTRREKGSPDGVMTAARTTTTQIAWRLKPLNDSRVTIPRAESTAMIVGNSNTIPNVSIIDMNSEIYEDSENVFGTSGLT